MKEKDQDEEMERPTRVEAEVSPRASSRGAASSGAVVVSPPSTPQLREVPDVQRRGQVQECPQCRERIVRIVVGQYICQHCNKGLRKRIPHDAARRHLASARNQYVGNIATLTGKAVRTICAQPTDTT